jgi:hypothetical protein
MTTHGVGGGTEDHSPTPPEPVLDPTTVRPKLGAQSVRRRQLEAEVA